MEALSVVTAAPKAEPTVLPKQNVPMGTATAPSFEDTHATAIMTTEEAETERYVVSRAATPKYLTTVRPVEKTPAPAEVTEKAAAEATGKVATEGTAAVETGTKGVLEEGTDGASGEKVAVCCCRNDTRPQTQFQLERLKKILTSGSSTTKSHSSTSVAS